MTSSACSRARRETQVVLKIAADASGKDAHEVTVTPIADDSSLRNLAWIEANRRKVQELSGGKLAYVYLPDTAHGRPAPISTATTLPSSTSRAR